jgi:hypothetical protein
MGQLMDPSQYMAPLDLYETIWGGKTGGTLSTQMTQVC